MNIELFPKQVEFWEKVLDDTGEKIKLSSNELTEFYYFGGYGAGKSRVVMTILHVLCSLYPIHAVIIRQTYPELSDSTIPQYETYFQGEGYYFNKSSRVAMYDGGARLDFRAFGDEPTKILSNEYDLIAFCQMEEVNEELWLQCKGRNRRRSGGLKKNIFLGEGNPSSGWVKKYLKDKALPSHVWLTEAKTMDNPFLPKEYIEGMLKSYPEHWIKRYILGEWSSQGDEVFSEFRESHIVPVIDPKFIRGFKVQAGLDYGWVNPCAIVWGFVDYDGGLTIFDEWSEAQKTPKEIAEQGNRYGRIVIVGDYSMKRPDRDGRSVWDDLCNENMLLLESNKQEIENIMLANTLFKTGRLKITKNCVTLLQQIRDYKWKRLKLGQEKNAPETPVDKDNHCCDALLYLIASLEELKSDDPKKRKESDTLRAKTFELPEFDFKEKG